MAALAEDVQITYKGPRAPVDLGPLLPSDDEEDDPYDPSKDPSLASLPPSPPLPPFSDDDDSDAEFEEVGPAGGGSEAEVKARKEAADAKRRAKRETRERLLREKDERRKERERRRRERQRRREANPMKAEWLPALPPKHSWKQTPVSLQCLRFTYLAADVRFAPLRRSTPNPLLPHPSRHPSLKHSKPLQPQRSSTSRPSVPD